MKYELEKRKEAEGLREVAREARQLAEKLGLEPYDVNYWVVDHDEINRAVAYGGFQTRYPHWRWGMNYDKQRKQDRFTQARIYELVVNDDPCHAYLQVTNDLADQKAVITHVEAHADFFANNRWFREFTEGFDAAATLSRHAESIEEYMSDPEVDREEVEEWIDNVLCLEDNIDQHGTYGASAGDEDDLAEKLDELDLSDEVKREVFDEEWLEEQTADGDGPTVPEKPEKDILAFLADHGKTYDDETGKAVEYEDWQRDVIEILRREAYYFAPQKMTKVMNEGWSCVAPDTRVFTSDGVVPMREVVEDRPVVSDGEERREVYDAHVETDHRTVTVETRRGFLLEGSNNHRVRRPDGSWVRLDELSEGDEIEVSGGAGVWADEPEPVEWENPTSTTLHDVADEAGVSVWTVMRYQRVGRAEKDEEIRAALEEYEGEPHSVAQRDTIRVPDETTPQFGRFLGLLVGDGHVSRSSGHVGFTTAEREAAEEFARLATELFGVSPSVEKQGSRWRVYVYSVNLVDLLTDEFGLPVGDSSAEKTVPEHVLRSPKVVVAEFLRGLFDADGYAGEQGVILSTKSEEMSKTVQIILANLGVLSRRREQTDGCYHVHMTGKSASVYAEEVGFGYEDKRDRLREYLDEPAWFEDESWTDEVVSVSKGIGAVYDISVDETHRYAAAGFVNHNSYWESTMMGNERFAGDDEILTYADHQAKVLSSGGLNPYKLGKELWEYVENTTNRTEVVERLLRVEGVTPANFHDRIDFDAVQETLEPTYPLGDVREETLEDLRHLDTKVDHNGLDAALSGEIDVSHSPWKVLSYEGLAERNFSLTRPQNRGFLRNISREDLEETYRYLFDTQRYASVEEGLEEIDYTAGWGRMREIRATHNDVTFIDQFLTEEFVRENAYFVYEHSHATGNYHVTSKEYEDVKKKLLLQFTNFGKPTILVKDANYDNAGELLLVHQYNGVVLNTEKAKRTLERVHSLWGRPVNLKTIRKEVDDNVMKMARRRGKEPEPNEKGVVVRYDGKSFETRELDDKEVEDIKATSLDYDTKPEDWL